MHAMGKNVIPAIAVFLLILSSCKKDTLSNTDKIKGLWRMEASFWDKDSNGLDSGDEVYYVKPSDTIMWNFLPSGVIEYYINGSIHHSGLWFATLNRDNKNSSLLLDNDLEYNEYTYKIQEINSEKFMFYSKIQKVRFSNIYNEWWGFVLIR
jgi:hypothetical protein